MISSREPIAGATIETSMRRKLAVLGFALVLMGCSDVGPSSREARDKTFSPSWLPAAQGDGNLLVCLSKDVTVDELSEVTMPARLLFQSWGRQLGPLRDNASFDPQAIQTGPAADALSSYAVVTVEPFVVSQEHPCVKVKTRAVTNAGFRWSHESISADLRYMFQVEDLEITSDFRVGQATELPDESPVKQVLLGGALFATPIAPIADPIQLGRVGE